VELLHTTTTVELTQGVTAVIDSDRFVSVDGFKWHVNVTNSGKMYARTCIRSEGRRRMILLHRLIMGVDDTDGVRVIFVDGDGLNCRVSNMRLSWR